MATRDMMYELLLKMQQEAADFRLEMREFKANTDDRFDRIEERLGGLEDRLLAVEGGLVAGLTQTAKELQRVILLLDDHGRRGRRIGEQVDDHERRLGALEGGGGSAARRVTPPRGRKR